MPVLDPVIDARLYLNETDPHTWDFYYAHALGSGAPVDAMFISSPAGASAFTMINYAASIGVSELTKAAFIFDTSGISEAPQSATFKLYGRPFGSPSSGGLDIVCFQATFAGNTSFVDGDWDAWNEAIPSVYTDVILASNWNTAGYNNFNLTSRARDDMASLDNFKMMCSFEIDATYIGNGGDTDDDPPDDSSLSNGYWGTDSIGSRVPFIIYDGYSHAVSGIDGNDISEINGVPVISVSDIDGIDAL